MKPALIALLVVLAAGPVVAPDAHAEEFVCVDLPALVVEGRILLEQKRLCVPVP